MGRATGALSTSRVPVAAPRDTVLDTIQALRGRTFDSAATVAVCEEGRLVGLVSIESLLAADPATRLSMITDTDPPMVSPELDQEHAGWRAAHAPEGCLAVVDHERRFLGLVPPRLILAVLQAEHSEDMARIGGFLHDAESARRASGEPLRRRLWHRLPWLLLGLAGAMLASAVVGRYEAALEADVIIAFFIPGIVYMADAVGTQTETLVIRGLSVGVRIGSVVRSELLTGLVLAAALATLFVPFSLLAWGRPDVSAAVGLALFAACSTATLVALFLPWLFHRLGRDPAFGSGPLATVVQDLLSLLVYFWITTAMLR
jgi:magnesium transporter